MRGGKYKGWLPDLFVGNLLQVRCRCSMGIACAGMSGACLLANGAAVHVRPCHLMLLGLC